MATAAKNIFHNLHSSEKRGLSRQKTNEDSSDFKAKKEEDKHLVASWEAGSQKTPLSPNEVAKDPEKKSVGKSSKHLGRSDFKLLETLGTGALSGCLMWDEGLS